MSEKAGVDPHEWAGEWTVDSFNTVILGRTQTGKTSTARELHAESPRLSVWVNEPGDSRVPDVASEGQPVQSVEGVRKAFARDQWKINFLSSDRDRDIPELQSFLWSVADRADRRLPMQIIIDEAHRPAPQSQKTDLPARDAIRRLMKEGNKRGVKTVLVTQDPISLDKQALRQSEYRVVFDLSAEQQDAVSAYNFNMHKVARGPRWNGAVHDASGDVLDHDVQAAEKYA